MAKHICSEEYESKELSPVENPAKEDASATQNEFDFVERPSEDFFCPVTFELLLNPHQTTCCGNHLSEKAVRRLQRDGKPCPMCKELQLSTMPDKFHRRRVSAVQVRCPHTPTGCEWAGEVGVVNQHAATCLKRPWKCQYCEFTSTSDVERTHVEQCIKYPVPCPNECEVGMIPRCDVEKHRTECPLEPVACEFADVGCSVKMARRDLKRHIEESQQQHLLSATLLNLKLTKETIAEKDRLLALKEQQLTEKVQKLAEKEHQLAEKDHQISDKDNQLAEKDRQIADKDHQIAHKDKQLAERDCQVANKDQQLAKRDKVIAMKGSQMLDALLQLQQGVIDFTGRIHGFSCHTFTLEKFSECQERSGDGDWVSQPFCSLPGNYTLKLDVETKQKTDHMTIRLMSGGKFDCVQTFIFGLQLRNQQSSHSHYFRVFEVSIGGTYSSPQDYIQFKELYKRDKAIRYLKGDCLNLILWIKTKS